MMLEVAWARVFSPAPTAPAFERKLGLMFFRDELSLKMLKLLNPFLVTKGDDATVVRYL